MNRRFWSFRAASDNPQVGELLLYGLIGTDDGAGWLFDQVTPKTFKGELDALGEISELRVFINSPGGDVFAGQAIHSMLKRHPARVTVHVDGLAASVASLVVMAGDRVLMPRNAMLMVHDPWTMAVGDAQDFRKIADNLDQIREAMLAAYQGKTGLEREELLPLLEAETWMTAEEAVERGFADEIEEAKRVAASLVRPGVVAVNGQEFDLSRYRNVPSFPPRDAGQEPTKRDAERALRDAGLSASRAKAIVAVGWDGALAMALPPHSTPKAPEDQAWEAPVLADFTEGQWEELANAEKRRIARHYVWTDEMPPTSFGALKGPHHQAARSGVGAVVWRAISSGRLRQMREFSDQGVKEHIARHYHQFDRQAPWEEEAEGMAVQDGPTPEQALGLWLEYQRIRARLNGAQ